MTSMHVTNNNANIRGGVGSGGGSILRSRFVYIVGVILVVLNVQIVYYVMKSITISNEHYNHLYDNSNINDPDDDPSAITTTTSSTSQSSSEPMTATTVNISSSTANYYANVPKIYFCHYYNTAWHGKFMNIFEDVLPEYMYLNYQHVALASNHPKTFGEYDELRNPQNRGNPYDVFIMQLEYPCSDNFLLHLFLEYSFVGKIIYTTSEHPPIPILHSNTYYFGPLPSGSSGTVATTTTEKQDSVLSSSLSSSEESSSFQTSHSMRLTFLQASTWSTIRSDKTNQKNIQRTPTTIEKLTNIKYKPQNTQEHYLIYAHSNCKDFRDLAFYELGTKVVVNAQQQQHGDVNFTNTTGTSQPIHRGGKCGLRKHAPRSLKLVYNLTIIDTTNSKTTKNDNDQNRITTDTYDKNLQLFRNYRFCLTMEHGYSPGYVTEKIMIAFLAGCIPIYWGDNELVSDIFNPNAYIYYDIHNPNLAIQRISYLENNRTAYNQILRNEPILRDGNETLQKYFLFSENEYDDQSSSPSLKQQIRHVLGIDRYKFINGDDGLPYTQIPIIVRDDDGTTTSTKNYCTILTEDQRNQTVGCQCKYLTKAQRKKVKLCM